MTWCQCNNPTDYGEIHQLNPLKTNHMPHPHPNNSPICALQWRHNEQDGALNHQRLHCLLNHLFERRSKKTSKLRVTGLCAGNSPVTGEFPAQMASAAENVSIWWRHHGQPGDIPDVILAAHVCCTASIKAVVTALKAGEQAAAVASKHFTASSTALKMYVTINSDNALLGISHHPDWYVTGSVFHPNITFQGLMAGTRKNFSQAAKLLSVSQSSLIPRFMGPKWGLPGADRTQVGPIWATWNLLFGIRHVRISLPTNTWFYLETFFNDTGSWSVKM